MGGLEFGLILAQPAAPARRLPMVLRRWALLLLLCKGKWLSEGNKVIEERTGLRDSREGFLSAAAE